MIASSISSTKTVVWKNAALVHKAMHHEKVELPQKLSDNFVIHVYNEVLQF